MSKIKIIFSQTMMISTAILFGLGVEAFLYMVCGNGDRISWQWFIPLSIIATAFLCSVPTLLLLDEAGSKTNFNIRKILHFLCVLAVLTLCGWLFDWYDSVESYLVVLFMYVIIYVFVCIATYWLAKNDEIRINDALEGVRDDE
ncbi:MAG: DUF3021 family protein [Lachnospiraceae bacterium]|nr:DUF3021 family protein [Lachnospiraceae bacterium]